MKNHAIMVALELETPDPAPYNATDRGGALPQKSFSFTPGFSPVPKGSVYGKPFQRFPPGLLRKPLKWFLNNVSVFPPG